MDADGCCNRMMDADEYCYHGYLQPQMDADAGRWTQMNAATTDTCNRRWTRMRADGRGCGQMDADDYCNHG